MSPAMNAPVTAIVPCYRCTATIRRAVESIAAQTVEPAEVILVDDHSGDDTVAVLEKIRDAYPQGWIRVIPLERNMGAASARNAGWEAATQPYIAFLDADDSWHPRKIEIQSGFMQAHPDVALSGHNWRLERTAKHIRLMPRPSAMPPARLMLSNPFVTPSVMLRADLPFRFREGQRHMEDHLLWLEIVLAGNKAAMIHAPLTILHKRFGASGLSSQLGAMQKADFANWLYLRREKRIGPVTMAVMLLFSLLKYIRRLGIFAFRKLAVHEKD